MDGFFAGPHGELDWAVGGEEFDRDVLPELLRKVDAIVLGRVTYQELAAYWPFASKEDDRNAELVNTIPKIVFSKTLETVEWGKWQNARAVKDAPAEIIANLKQQTGKDMMLEDPGLFLEELEACRLKIRAFVLS